MKKILRLKKKLKDLKIDSFLISNASNIFYLTGFKSAALERESYFILNPKKNLLILPKMYQHEAKLFKKSDFEISHTKKGDTLLQTATSFLEGQVGFELKDLKYAEYEILKTQFKQLKAINNLVEDLRVIKSEEEIKEIKKAAELTDKIFNKIVNKIKINQTESEIAQNIYNLATKYGEDLAFPSIIACGKNSVYPHYKTAKKKINNRAFLLMDFGIKYNGYCSDLTRVVHPGKTDKKFKKLYSIVKEAQETAIKRVKEGIVAEEIHLVAQKVFKKYQLAENFLHGIGHGVGLDIHEAPVLGPKSKTILKEGMVITIEPGIYIDGWGGIRIEDMVLVKKEGFELLSKAPK